MGRKFKTVRNSQIRSSHKRYEEEMKRTEEDIQTHDVDQWKDAIAERERKNIKRLRGAAMMIVRDPINR